MDTNAPRSGATRLNRVLLCAALLILLMVAALAYREGTQYPQGSSARRRTSATALGSLAVGALLIAGFLAISRAMLAREAALAEARHTRDSLKTTLSSIGDAVISTDAAGRVVFANKVAQSLLRASETDIVGKHLDDIFHIVNEYTRAKLESPVTKVLREDAIVGLATHTVLIGLDGTETPIDDSAAPIRSVGGPIQGTVLVFRDTSERRRAQSARQLLASVVDSSDDAIVTKDLNGIITSWNAGAERTFGYTAEEMIGQPISILAAPGRWDEMPGILERIKRGERIDHYQTLRRTKAGKQIHISLTVSPVRDSGGQIAGASKIARDITAQVEAQAALEEQRERLRVTLGSIGDAVITADTAGRVSYLNQVAEQLTGWTSTEAAGKPVEEIFRIVNKESGRIVENPVIKALRECRVVGLANHTLLITREGKAIAIDDTAAPIRSAHGEMLGVVLVFRDITERRAAQKLLFEQAAELRQRAHFIERVHCFARDLQDRIVFWNQGAIDLYGFSPMEAVGQTSYSLLKTVFPVPLDQIQAQLMSAGDWDGELVHTRRDGSRVTVASHWALHRDTDGRPAVILEVNTDITARKRAEESLRRSEERLATILKHLPVGVGLIDTAGRVLLGNPLWDRYLREASVDDQEDARWRATTGEGQPRPRYTYPAIRALQGEEVLPGFDFRRRDQDGVERWTRIGAVPLRDPDGQIIGALTMLRDIDEERRADEQHAELLARERALAAERALRESEAELARVVRALSVGELAASIAHEINQPLAGVVTNAEAGLRWLSGEAPNLEEARQSLALIARDGNRASAVIRRIREFLMKESQQTASLDLNDVIQDAVAIARAELSKREVLLQMELGRDLPRVRGDRIQLQQVILNLVMNGAEAMTSIEGPKKLHITSERSTDGFSIVTVRDSGVGISPGDMPRMFEAFFTTKPAGMGIGLSISRSIIEAHGGRIWAALNDGSGLTVQFGLPAADPTQAASNES